MSDGRGNVRAGANSVAAFYDRFPYPAQPSGYALLLDEPWLFAKCIGQEVGRRDWRPKRILVAGCGAVQAINTALAFPEATVIGIDVSEQQVGRALKTWSDLRSTGAAPNNLGLWAYAGPPRSHVFRQDLHDSLHDYGTFDYIVCTGVLHHCEDPPRALRRLRDALAPDGIMELMVYHEQHVRPFVGIRDAVKLLLPNDSFDAQYALAQRLAVGFEPDTLINPVIHSYNVSTLAAMLGNNCMRLLQPRHMPGTGWEWPAEVPEERRGWSDLTRWRVVDALRGAHAPMLWFYAEHAWPSNAALVSAKKLDLQFENALLKPFAARLRPWSPVTGWGEPTPFPPPLDRPARYPIFSRNDRLSVTTQSCPFMEMT